MKNLIKKLTIAIFLAITLVVSFTVVGCRNKKTEENELTVKELKAYELVLKCSYKFKNPSSVRIISGMLYYNPTTSPDYLSASLRLSATNGFGATTSGYYFCGYNDDGSLFFYDIEDYKDVLYSSYLMLLKDAGTINDFNIDKVNKKLAEKWEY